MITPSHAARSEARLSDAASAGDRRVGEAISAAGEVALELLGVRVLAEAERIVMRTVAERFRAEWAALYRPVRGGYLRSRDTRSGPGTSGDRLDVACIERGAGVGAGLLLFRDAPDGPDEARLAIELRSEFHSRPTLLLLGFDAGSPPEPAHFSAIEAVAAVCAEALRNAELIERLESQVFVDVVTGCYNRRAFEEHLKVELVRARRYERPISLILLDLDDFKRINDELGHSIGDHALQRVSEVLRSAFRTTDRVCRFGGDEFAVIFPETPREEVTRLAERLRRQIAGIFPDDAVSWGITASIGIAGYPYDGTRQADLVRSADRALYQAKAEGRDRVALA